MDRGRASSSVPWAPAGRGAIAGRCLRRGAFALCVLGIGLAPDPCDAQAVLFQPEILFGVGYTDNARILGDGDDDTTIYRLGAVLPVTRTLRRGSLHFSYSPLFERFEDVEELDNVGHRASFRLDTWPTEVSTFGLQLGYTRLEDERDPREEDPALVFLTEPIEREIAAVGVSFSRRMSLRWSWATSLGFSDWSFQSVEDTAASTALEDRQETRGSFSLRRRLDEHLSFGGDYDVRHFELAESGTATAHLVGLAVDRAVMDRLSLGLALGAYFTEREIGDSTSGVQGLFSLTRSYRRVMLNLSLSHRPSVGGVRPGTAVISVAQVGLTGSLSRQWSWGLFGRYGHRSPDLEGEPSLSTVSVGGSVERRFKEVLALRLGASYAEQLADADVEEGSVLRANLSLVIYPLARTGLGGRGS